MGWMFKAGETKAGLIEHLCNGNGLKTLARAVRGNVLWTVHESAKPDGSTEKWIGCYLLGAEKNFGWGYKDMDESMGPYYFTCPLKFLDMAPEKSPEWRARVRAYAERAGKKLTVGETVKLIAGCSIPEVTITSVRPLRGTYNGQTYRVARKLLA